MTSLVKQKVFFSYSFNNHQVIEYYYSMFSKYAKDDFEVFFYDRVYHKRFWGEVLKDAIKEYDIFVFFLGKVVGKTQEIEHRYWSDTNTNPKEKKLTVLVPIEDLKNSKTKAPEGIDRQISYKETYDKLFNIYQSFKDLYFSLKGNNFRCFDGLPLDIQPFNYEKDIINFYQNKYIIGKLLIKLSDQTDSFTRGEEVERIEEILKKGVFPNWPLVKINTRIEENKNENNLERRKRFEQISNPIISEIGSPRKANVLAAALTNYHQVETYNIDESHFANCENFCLKDHAFSFPEAGPREKIYMPINIPFDQHYNVAILVTGGIAPGINAVIDGITQRHFKYAKKSNYLDKLHVIGFKNGFKSFLNESNMVFLYPDKQSSEGKPNAIVTSEMINLGGCMIGTSRWSELEEDNDSRYDKLKDIIYSLKRLNINTLYIIGGEGSMKAAHALYSIYDKKFPESDHWRLNIVGIPKTMDNDILWVWQTFGFMSAVEKAREFIDYLAVETSVVSIIK